MSGAKIITREATGLDKHFIMSTWLKGQRYGNDHYRAIPDAIYFTEYTQRIGQLILTHNMKILIACAEDDPTWIVGFAVFKEPELYWVYVKRDFREKGIANLLLKNRLITTAKALTKIGQAIIEKKRLIFNPF